MSNHQSGPSWMTSWCREAGGYCKGWKNRLAGNPRSIPPVRSLRAGGDGDPVGAVWPIQGLDLQTWYPAKNILAAACLQAQISILENLVRKVSSSLSSWCYALTSLQD